MRVLLILNDAPYGSETAYNALRLAVALQSEIDDAEILIFLLADAVTCALPNQSTPQGDYNLDQMLEAVTNEGGQIGVCGTCADARGIKDLELIERAEISTTAQLAQWVLESDRVVTF